MMTSPSDDTPEDEREMIVVMPGCHKCGCNLFFVGEPESADDAETFSEDRYRYHPVWRQVTECVNCGDTDFLYTTD